ncbi:diguanylate cyclase domain-containing protein [Pseudoduganella sp. UC29_106]|uniref:diguanylate cyclase domain-containing protein n=1 Tax=Pseudoduganella sp. UC29_106 TaxID=3374553 RepID=UPI0037576A1C
MTTLPRRRWLLANLLLLAAYLVTGRFGLYLSLAPGYATPLFLPAGIALAAVASRGPALLPGVALGALLVNLLPLPAAPDPFTLPTASQAMAALCAALGASLQAGLAAHAFRRWIRPDIGAGRDVLLFLLLAPLASLVSSTVSIGGAALAGAVAVADAPANWLAWWIGDAVGMLLAAPLVWIVIAEPRALWWRRRWLVGLPLLVLMTTFIAVYVQVAHWEAQQRMQGFRLKAQQVGDLLQARFSEHERYLYAMSRGITVYGNFMTRDDFRKFASGYLDQRPELLSMAWLRPVEHADRERFEAWARVAAAPDFQLRQFAPQGENIPAPRRPHYLVATFIEPQERAHYLGVDILGSPQRAGAVDAALRSGFPAASAPHMLMRRGAGRGIVLMQAVRAADGAPPMGVLQLSLYIESFVQVALQQAYFPHLRVKLEDTSDGAPVIDQLERVPHLDAVTRTLHLGGRSYRLTMAPTLDYALQQRGWQSWTALTAGLALTGLLGALMLLISGERAQIQAQVKQSTAQLREREARLQAILDKAADAILTIGCDGAILSANAAAGDLFGQRPDALRGQPLARFLPLPEGQAPGAFLRHVAEGDSREHEAEGRRSNGEAFPLALSVSEVDLPDGHLFVTILHDLTEQQRAQERIYRLAHHDPLTGLDNRLSLNLRLEQLLAQTRRSRGQAAVMFLDLDHFKKINDTHGHQTGDLLLQAVADRLRELLREVDTIARLGGDEFIVVTNGAVTPEDAGAIAVRIVDALAAPFQLAGKLIHSGTSVGVAMFPADGDNAATLLRHADTAMYAAKSQGRGNFQFFQPAMNAATHERLLMENRLQQGLEQQQFELYLQPQVALSDSRLLGAEVLLRWHHPELGMVSPNRFIPIAEESGLILPLGEWVLTRAVQLLDKWRASGLGHLRLAVNLSARQCHGSGLLPLLDRLLANSGVDASRLELEITESAAMQDPGTQPPPAARTAPARHHRGHRRFRHRLFLAQLPEAVRARSPQDRPRVRERYRDRSE